MGERHLIDSNVLIDYLNGNLPDLGKALLRKAVNDTPLLSVISKIEVLSYKNTEDARKLLLDFIENSNVFELSKAIVDTTINIRTQKKIKIPDAIIAATALVFDFTLLTRNTADFVNIQGLKMINPWMLKSL
jgi:predicted nucleic acid-binding protein